MNHSPLELLADIVLKKKKVIIFTRNNKKIIATLRAFDKHFNLILENAKEIWSFRQFENRLKFQERTIQKLLIRVNKIELLVKKYPMNSTILVTNFILDQANKPNI